MYFVNCVIIIDIRMYIKSIRVCIRVYIYVGVFVYMNVCIWMLFFFSWRVYTFVVFFVKVLVLRIFK